MDLEELGIFLDALKNDVKIALAEAREFPNSNLYTVLCALRDKVDAFHVTAKVSKSLRNGEQDYATSEKGKFVVNSEELLMEKWEPLGKGHFANVFKAKYKGCSAAVKVIRADKGNEHRLLNQEGKLLRHLNHDNIIAFRGMGFLLSSQYGFPEGSLFLVMEYMPHSIKSYMHNHNTYERKGLPKRLVWKFAKQIAHGLSYLHTLAPPFYPVAHRDLKPDNILLDQIKMKVKLADFGLAQHVDSSRCSTFGNLRWAAPEIVERAQSEVQEKAAATLFPDEMDLAFHMRADIFPYGSVVAYCLTGQEPWSGEMVSGDIGWFANAEEEEARIKLPENLGKEDPLRLLIEDCYVTDPRERPATAEEVVQKHFAGVKNPYKPATTIAEFFSCGFLKDTKIFVADSLVDQNSDGYFSTKATPSGYPLECLSCVVEVREEYRNYLPEEDDNRNMDNVEEPHIKWNHHELYYRYLGIFMDEAKKNIIEDNPAIQLKRLTLLREGDMESQSLVLEFVQGTYVHHRAMRAVWMSLEERKQDSHVPYKGNVHPIFSTSFGLHVAVITADNKFFFCRRSNRRGIASPKTYTCGAVESASVKDYTVDEHGVTRVSLLKTAARGLMEELRVELKDNEVDAICLSTIYLKFDKHEWGMCGFVHLADERIAPERRLTCEQLRSRFVSGPKDKFEHDLVEVVDFDLESMVHFVYKNRDNFASSGKLVVVKVLQSFFGIARVEQAFQVFENT